VELRIENIQYKGIVSREETEQWYQQSDIFLFPTLSDGFGLTQLEAMAWQLPVLASTHCASVVQENQTGWLLEKVEAKEIETLLKKILDDPKQLEAFASNCLNRVHEFSTADFASNLEKLIAG
jgi:glycosyltransferase involved in cell wall biosynthesis